ncbi:MAG: MlaE family ABC transporter permease [Flavobacteriales bacterium]
MPLRFFNIETARISAVSLTVVSTFQHIGRYCLLLAQVFTKPEKARVYRKLLVEEFDKIGLQSIGIVGLMVGFMGAVVCIQTAANIESGWVPGWTIGFTTRQSVVLEFSSTIACLILSGKVGGNIATEIGTMRITEQIDAMEIMGVNTASYLILPKIIAAVLIFPFIMVIAMFLGIASGAFVGLSSGIVSMADYQRGLMMQFETFQITYSLIKTLVYAFIITSVSAYHGYYTHGGPREVGQSSTRSIVYSMVLILIANYLLTQILLID